MMKVIASAAVIAMAVASCSGPPGGTLIPDPSAAATSAGDPTIVAERGPGIDIKTGDSGTVDLSGGHYRIAWYAPGCTMLGLQVAAKNGDTTSIDVRLPSGEAFVDLEAGVFVVNRVGDCDYTVRFEDASS
jgi:hypothetical protein